MKSTFANAKITLGENPLNCCGLHWLQTLLNRTNSLLDDDTTFCAVPGKYPLMTGPVPASCGDERPQKTLYSKDELVGACVGAIFLIRFVQLVLAIVFLVCRGKRDTDTSLKTPASKTLTLQNNKTFRVYTSSQLAARPTQANTNRDVKIQTVLTFTRKLPSFLTWN